MTGGLMNRRRFLKYAGLATTAAVATACGGAAPTATTAPEATQVSEPTATSAPAATTAPEATTAPAEAAGKYNEAPMLAEMVAAGELPPVEERLPLEPLVIPVVEEIGQYGGTWHRVAVGPSDAYVAGRLNYESFMRFPANSAEPYLNLIKGYEVNEDATEFTFYLREGMKWSDGAPFTADDFMFRYEAGLLNPDLTPTFPSWMRDPVNLEPCVWEKVDDYTFKMKFQSPYGLLLLQLTSYNGNGLPWPKHYLQQFHPDYADADELAQMTKDAGFEHWYQLFGQKNNWQNPDLPVISAWKYVRVPPDVPVVAERNPYYWKVDPEGNQLPYIDRIQLDVVENADLLNLKAVAGEIDMQFRHILWNNYPIFIENAEQGDYRVFRWTLAEGSNAAIMLNHTHMDPVMRELIETREFRIALSHGMDRSAINELAYIGFGEGRNAALIPQCPYFKEEHARMYADLDVDKANQILDDIGLTERDGEGFRLRPDGQPLSITIEYAPVFGPWRDVVQMTCDQWQAIGIRGIPKEEDRSLFTQRGSANERDAGIWTLDRSFTPMAHPYWWLPTPGGYAWGELYGTWYDTRGEQGEEPPDWIKRQFDLYDQIKAVASEEERAALAEQFFDNFAENIPILGTVGLLPHVGVVKNNFRNVPEEAISDVLQLTPGNTIVEQYFIRQS